MKSLEDIRRVRSDKPLRAVIYGPPGVGKTSLASEFPAPIVLQTEDGESVDTEFDSFGLLESWPEFYSALGTLANSQHDYQTVIIDSIDKLEPLIWADACQRNEWDSIEAPGYGKGYVEIDSYWHTLFRGLNYLRNECSMTVLLIGHSAVVQWPNPTGVEFPRWDIRLHKRAHGIVEDSVDAILMLDYDASTFEQKGKGGAKTTKSTGSTLRWIHAQGSPARNAKNRHGMPARILYEKGKGYEALAPYLKGGPAVNGAVVLENHLTEQE